MRQYKPLIACASLLIGLLFSFSAIAVPLLISISNPPAAVNVNTAGQSQFWPNAGTLGPGGAPISLRATLVSISAGDSIRLFTSGDNPVVRANTGTLSAEVLWEVFDANTGLPIQGDPDFLITDIDGSNGSPIESVSAACAGLTSYSVNGTFLPGCNANNNAACQTNIRVSESMGSILAEGTQNQNAGQQEGYMQYSWTNVSSWTVNYFATTGGRWYVHDADGDIPFDGATEIQINLVDLATVKGLAPGSLATPAMGEEITFQIDLSNLGPANATNANLTDLLPAGLNYVSHTVTAGNYVPATGVWSGINVAVNDVETLTITAEVTAAAGTTITNTTTTALADESICSSRDLLTYSFVVAETPDPQLTIEKTVSNATVFSAAGDTITYQYVVNNTGNVTITDVSPVDTGPTFNMQTATNSLSSFSPAMVDILPGQSATFTATYLLDQDDVDNIAQAADPLTAIDNSATATGTPPVGSVLPAVPASMAETGLAITPVLSVVKSVSNATAFSEAGDVITYQYIVTNNGNVTIENVVPTDVGPTFNGAAAAGTLSAFMPASANLAPNASQTFTATYQLQQADVDNMAAALDPLTAIDNVASATGDPLGATSLPVVPDSMVETGFAPMPSLTIIKSVSSATTFSQAGDTITYTFDVENNGNVTINGVVPVDSGPTFNGIAASNSLSSFAPASASIMPGNSQQFTATYVLSQVDVDNLSQAADPLIGINNMATATGTPTGGTLPAVTPDAEATGFAITTALSLNKTVSAPTVGLGQVATASDAGDTIAYSFVVTNNSTVTLDSLTINDAGPSFNGMVGSGAFSAISCTQTVLAPTQSTTCTATYTLSQADVDNAIIGGANSIQNTATAAANDPSDNVVNSISSMANTDIANQSGIELSKTASAPTVANGANPALTDPGDTIAYQIVAQNTGNTTLSSVLISDTLTTVNCPAMTQLGNPFVNDGSGSLAVSDSITCTAVYTLDQDDINSGLVQNTADVVSQDPASNAVNDSDTETTGFTQRTSLLLTKTAAPLPANPMVGDSLQYTFELENTGNVSLTNPEVNDPRCQTPANPLNFTNGYVSGDGGVVGELDAGEVWVFECDYAITQPDINAGEIANTATATGVTPVASGLPNPTTQASALADAQQNTGISLEKVAGTPTFVAGSLASVTDEGDTVSYSITVENTGNVTLSNVTVTDPVITDPPNSGSITCPMSTLLPSESMVCQASYSLTLADVNAGVVNNTASVTADPPPSVPPLDSPTGSSSASAVISPVPSLEVTKSIDTPPAMFVAGQTIVYAYQIVNTGNVTINNVVPVDTGPTFNGVLGTNSLSAFTPASVSLDPGQMQTFTANYVFSQADIDNLFAATDPLTGVDNTATADGQPANGSLAAVPPSTVETGSSLSASMVLRKSSTPPSPVTAGTAITYTFDLENTGDVTISNPTISDARCQIPGSTLSFASGYQSGDSGATPQSLDVGETWQFNCTYAITQADIDGGTVQNTATASGQDPAGSAVMDDSDSTNAGDDTGAGDDPTNTPLAQTASWSVAKSALTTPTQAGDTIDYQFVLTNTGNVSISNVVISDAKCATAITLVNGDLDSNAILAPDEVWTYQCTSIAITQTEVNAGNVLNSVSVSGVPPSGSLADANANNTVPVLPAPALSISKSVAAPTTGLGGLSAATDAGDTISYSFIVTNEGNVTLDSLNINDSGPTFNGVAGTGSLSSLSCPLTTLEPQQSTTCTGLYTLSQQDVDNAIAGGSDAVANSAQAQAQDPGNNAVTSPADEAMTTIMANSTVDIVKTASNATVTGGSDPAITDPGDTISYTLAVSNTGNNTLDSVTVSDSIATVSCPAMTDLSNPFTNGTSSLAVGDSITCMAIYALTQDDINGSGVVNTANVDAQDQAGTPVSGVSEISSGVTQKTSLSLSKTVTNLPNNPAQLNDLINYEFSVDNTGNVSLSAAQVSDAKCDNPGAVLTRTSGYVSGDTNNDQLLDADEVWLFACTHVVTIADINAGGVENSATATGTPPVDSGLPAPTNSAGSIAELGQQTGILLDKVGAFPSVAAGTLPTITDVGDTITFTFNVTNTGNVTLTNVMVDDPLITSAPNSQPINCTFPTAATTLNTGQTATCTGVYSLTQADIDAGSVSNEATATGTPPNTVPPSTPPEAGSSSMVPINAAPSLGVAKTASPLPSNVIAGTVITYTYEVTNTGNVTINNVEPVDLGPTFNGVNATNSLSPYDTGVTPQPINLAPGEMQTFTATYVISQVDLDNMAAAGVDAATAIDNSATVDGEPVNGNLAPVTPSTVETGVTPDPLLTLTKSSTAPANVAAGALITYEFTLRNDGNVTIDNPIINDARCQSPGTTLSFVAGYVSGDTGIIAESLDVGETWLFRCEYALTQADIDTGNVVNTALASGQDPAGNTIQDDSDSGNPGDDTGAGNDATNTPLTRTPNWSLTKSTTSTPTMVGDTLDYTFVIENTGNVSISAVSVVDLKCASPVAGMASFVSSSDIGSDGVLSPAGFNNVPTAEQWTYTCTSVPVTQLEVDAGQVNNSALASGTAAGGGLVDAPGSNSTPIVRTPEMSLVKSAGATSLNNDGTFDQVFNFSLKNVGNVTLSTVVLSDDLNSQFGSCFDSVINSGTLALNDVAPANDSTMPTAAALPNLANSVTLSVGDSIDLSGFIVRFNPNALGCVLPSPAQNSATATAVAPDSSMINDGSDNGLDPDTAVPNDAGVPTPFVPPIYTPELGMAKAASAPSLNPDGTFDVTYTLLIQNTGNVNLTDLSVVDDLTTQFGATFTASAASDTSTGVITMPTVNTVTDAAPTDLVLPQVNIAYDGSAADLIDAANRGLLGVGDSIELEFTIRINPNAVNPAPLNYLNTASVQARDPANTLTTDDSNSGSDPTVGAGGSSQATQVLPPATNPQLGMAKEAELSAFSGDTFDVRYTLLIQNTGDLDLQSINLFDDIATQLGAVFTPSSAVVPDGGVIVAPEVLVVTDANASDLVLPNANLDYDGTAVNLLDGSSGYLGVGDVMSVTFTIRIRPDESALGTDTYENTATVEAIDPSGASIMDDSDTGNDPTLGAGGVGSPTVFVLNDVFSLPISLSQFQTSVQGEHVFFKWETQTEVSNLGFNLYARLASGWVKLNDSLIISLGDSTRIQKYEYLSEVAATRFAISDVDIFGKETMHGPYQLGRVYGQSDVKKIIDWSTIQLLRKNRQMQQEQRKKEYMKQRQSILKAN